MKRINWLFLVFALLGMGCGSHPKGVFVINGQDDSGNGANLVLLQANSSGKWDTIQRIVSHNGKFQIEGRINNPNLYYLAFDGRVGRGEIPLMLEDTIFSVRIFEQDLDDFRNFEIKGGKLQSLRNEVYSVQRHDFRNLDSIMNLIEKADREGDIASKMHQRFYVEMMGADYDRHENEFIAKNKDNIVGLSLIFSKYKYLSYELLSQKFSLLSDSMKNTVEGKLLQERLSILQKLAPNSIAPDFKIATLDGDTTSLQDLKGKVKILDFWASWCGPCRAANPHMKEIYKKYKNKGLVMLGISMDISKKAWEEAVKADGLEWLQASNLDGTSGEIAKKYRITGIPRVFVLDANNRILGETTNYREIVSIIEDIL